MDDLFSKELIASSKVDVIDEKFFTTLHVALNEKRDGIKGETGAAILLLIKSNRKIINSIELGFESGLLLLSFCDALDYIEGYLKMEGEEIEGENDVFDYNKAKFYLCLLEASTPSLINRIAKDLDVGA